MCKEIYSRVFKCCRYEGSAGLLLSQEITDVETSVGCGSALKCSELRLSQHRVGAGSTWPPRHEPLAAREAPGGGGGTRLAWNTDPRGWTWAWSRGSVQQQNVCAPISTASPPTPWPPRRAAVEEPLLSLHRDGDHPAAALPLPLSSTVSGQHAHPLQAEATAD